MEILDRIIAQICEVMKSRRGRKAPKKKPAPRSLGTTRLNLQGEKRNFRESINYNLTYLKKKKHE